MNVILLDLSRDRALDTWRVRGLAGAPPLARPFAEWPSVETALAELHNDGWTIVTDRRTVPGPESTISLIHDGTPPRAPGDLLAGAPPASAHPPARRTLGAGYMIDGPRYPDHVADELTARLDQIVRDAYQGMAAIQADTRLSGEGKAEAVAQTRTTALRQLQTETEAALAAVQFDRADLDQQAHAPLTVRPDDAPVLIYTRDALQVRWTHMSAAAIENDWQRAIADGDLVAVRVFRDYAESAIRAQPPWNEPGAEKLWPPRRVSDLLAASDRSLMGAERCTAADTLKKIDLALLTIKGAAKRAQTALEGAEIDPATGTVLTAYDVAARTIARTST